MSSGIVLLLGVLGCKPAPQPDANPSSFGSRPEVDAAVLDIMESDRVPGVAVCTLVDGLTEWCQGYGWAHIEDQRQVSEDTPFLIASVSKLITGEAARQTLDASATVDVGFTVGHPGNGEMTHQMLATHTAGISDNWDVLEGYYVDGDSPIALGDFLFEYLDPSGSDYDDWENFGAPPGTEYDYSNVGAALLGYAVEVETGTDFSDWCDTEIFQPWGMTNTSWRLAALDEDTLAMPYTGLFSTDEAGHYGFPDYPDGGLRSSAVDMALFLEATVDLEHSELVPQLESGQGWVWYSWEVEGQTIWGHNGGETGVSTEVGMLEDGRGFVVLMNGEGGPNTLEDIEVAILGL